MSPFSKARTALAALRADLTGDVFRPEDPGYDDARTLFNACIDRRPAVIAQCETTADVVHCVRFARDLDLHIAVRGRRPQRRPGCRSTTTAWSSTCAGCTR